MLFHFKGFKRHFAALKIGEFVNSWFQFFDVKNRLFLSSYCQFLSPLKSESLREKNPSPWLCRINFSFLFVVELDCGGKLSENITHFTKSVSEGSSLTGKCEAKICRVTDNICQIRLDFSTFVLAGPSTDTRTTHYTSFGNVVGHSAPSRIAQTSIGE